MKVAVLDFGKTNSKLFVIDEEARIVSEQRTRPDWVWRDGVRVLDDVGLSVWVEDALTAAVERHAVEGVVVSGHGCTFALTDGDRLTHPILDYEQEPPRAIAARIDALAPPFAETFSPRLPLGFNYARHMLWLEAIRPDAFAQARFILGYPQYWTWRLGGRPVSEVSYLGCHSHLWAPLKRDFSSLVDRQGWRARMPPLVAAGEAVGAYRADLGPGAVRSIAVLNGVHDSNAALHACRRSVAGRFTLVSTGTWVVIFNPDCPLEALDERRDMLANVDVDGDPVATIRFMGGREFDEITNGWNGRVEPADIQRVIDTGAQALPNFAEGGPLQGLRGSIVGDVRSEEARAALALLYVALMIDLSLDLIASTNAIVVDGGLNAGGVLASLLAQLRPGQQVLQGATPEGSAMGAAALAFAALGRTMAVTPPVPSSGRDYAGLDRYRAGWRERLAAGRASKN
jgi:sugar (pentulose or hexulose) kinase